MKKYLAIDIGATSGRHIVDCGGELTEVFRFETGFKRNEQGTLICDVDKLFANVKEGIKKASEKFGKIESLAIDTWGVDYVLMRGNKEVLPCVSYRDERTLESAPKVHEIIPFEKLYEITGTQYQPFNTIYQLYADKLSGKLNGVTDFLMLPEYLNYKLTGVKKKEYTAASTTGLLCAKTRKFSGEIINALGLPQNLFASPLGEPGETVGELLPEIAAETGSSAKVLLCASHDTASAFEAVECGGDSVIISSGTWSIVGIKIPEPNTSKLAFKYNFSCEGGVGYIRFLKNVTGMWINVKLHEKFGKPFGEMTVLAQQSDYNETFDVNDPVFSAPDDMCGAITEWFTSRGKKPPVTDSDFYRTAYRSLALAYKNAIAEAEEVTGKTYKDVYIVGGGAKNAYLNKLTQEATGKTVNALPIEATAIGNLTVQKRADKSL